MTSRQKLREAVAHGPVRTETREGREFRVFQLRPADRAEMLKAAGLDESHRWAGVSRFGVGPDGDSTTEYDNDPVTTEFLREGGWGIVTPGNEGRDGGLTAHRGILHEDEYVDFFELRTMVEEELGFSYADVTAAYKTGRPSADTRQLRAEIDACLLALFRVGGNMIELAKAFGWTISPASADGGESCRQMERAIARAGAAAAREDA